jgi:hypothetical protein
MLKITCSNCHASLQVPPNLAGRKINCPKCKKPTLVAAPEPEPELDPVELEEILDEPEDTDFMPVTAKSPPKSPPKSTPKSAVKPPPKNGSKPKPPAKRSSAEDESAFEMDEPAPSRKGLWIGLGVGGGVLALALIGAVTFIVLQTPRPPADPFAELKAKIEAELKAKGMPGFPDDMMKGMPLPPGVDPKTLVPPDFNPQDLVPGPNPKSKKAKVDPAEVGKRATTVLHVMAGDGSKIDGCGFFAAGEKGLLVTNIDVVGMRALDAKPPSKIDVVVGSGEPTEKTREATLLGADRESNVAVLKIVGMTDDLPEPLVVESPDKGSPFTEKKPLVIGMPAADEADRHLQSTKGLVKYQGPGYFAWSLEGKLSPDQSGGPLINATGAAVGLCVVPRSDKLVQVLATGDQIRDACRGRVIDMQIRPVAQEGDEIRVPVEAYFFDPQKNIAKVAVEYWQAEFREPQLPVERKMTADDLKSQPSATFANGKATFDFPMPRPRNEQALWVRVAMSDAAGNTWWGPSHALKVEAVLERRGTSIKFDSARYPKNTIKIDTELESSTAGNGNANKDGMHVKFTELRKPLPDGVRFDLKFDHFEHGTHDFKPMWSIDTKATKALRACSPGFTLAADGHVTDRSPITLDSGLSPIQKIQAEDYLARTCNAIEASCLTLPSAALKVNDTWQSKFPFTLSIGDEPEIADVELDCTYNGIRSVEGKDRAVVSALGTLRPRKGEGSPILFGKAQVIFQLDPTSGCVLDARLWIVADYITPTRKRARSQWNTDFVRAVSEQVAAVPKSDPGPKTKTKTPPVTTTKAPPEKTPPEKTPPPKMPPEIAKTPSVEPVGDKATVGDLTFESVKVDAKDVRSLTWAADGKSFFCLQTNGKLQQFAAEDLAVMAEGDIGKPCNGMFLSSEGLLISCPAAEEVNVVDPTTLFVRRRIPILGLDRIAAGAKVPLAVAVTKAGEMVLFDVKTTKIFDKKRIDELATGAGTFLLIAMTPDGKYVFGESKLGKLHRMHVVDNTLVHEQSTRHIASKTGRIDVSPDGVYVCLSCETGNIEVSLRTLIFQIEDLSTPDVILNTGATPRTVGFDPSRGTIYAQSLKYTLIAFSKSGSRLGQYELRGVGETRQIACSRNGDILVLTDNRLFRARRK